MAGYSGTPLPAKLGIKPGHRIDLVGAPTDFDGTLGALPAAVTLRRRLQAGADIAICFARRRAELARRLPRLQDAIEVDGAIWVAWPKRASGVATDLDGDAVRALALPRGLVDNKVCAIDETWSGLRLVYRRERRAEESARRAARTPSRSGER